VVLTDEVSRTLFAEYAAHRKSDRGREEIGWVLLGVREADRAVVLATLPAGAERDAGEAHVRFNSEAQALASRIVRQSDRRLTLLGIVHTHPGRMRWPSSGDYEGDRRWVSNLRGGEGVFGIGTFESPNRTEPTTVGGHPREHILTFEDLRFDWYTLAGDDKRYRPVPLELTLGPDLAMPLRAVWPIVETHAARLDRLARLIAKVRFEISENAGVPVLVVTVLLGEPGHQVRVLLERKTVRYVYEAGDAAFQADLPAGTAPDQGLFLLLAEVVARP